MSLVVSVLCSDDDPQRLSRRLVATVNHGPMHLTRVVATGVQVYPVNPESVRGTSTLLRCEFRMRNTGAPVTDSAVTALLSRISGYTVLDSHLVDGHGVSLGPATHVAAAS